MARGGRCMACDEKLGGGARFCAACGAPTGTSGLDVTSSGDDAELIAAGEPLVRERSRWLVPVGLLTVGALVTVLAFSRLDGDSSAAEPPPTTTPATTTTVPETTTTTTTTTTPAPTTVAPGFVDVSQVPADLADTTLILFGMGSEISALDLGTGLLTPLESEVSFRGDAQLMTSPLGIVQRRWTSSGEVVTVADWNLDELAAFDANELGPMHAAPDGGLWTVLYDGGNTLARITPAGVLRPVRSLNGWASLVGTVDGDALVSSSWSGGTHRVATDGTTSLLGGDVALSGGRDWMLNADCTPTLDCAASLVDLASGLEETVELPDRGNWLQPGPLSWNGRRGLMFAWGREGPDQLLVIDVDEMSVSTVESPAVEFFGPGQGGYDHELRYAFRPAGNIAVVELLTGTEVRIELEDAVREIVVAPPGWEPPVRDG